MRIIAHRGTSGTALENSASAIRQAVGIGVSAIEIDVRLTQDHVLVVCHDANLFNLAGDPRVIKEHTWTKLQTARLHDGSALMRLEDAFKIANGTPLLVEIKDKNSEEALFKVLKQFPKQPVTICSFHLHELVKIKEQRPELRSYALTVMRPLKTVKFARDHQLEGIGLIWWMLNPLVYSRILRFEVKCYVYTVNNPVAFKLVRRFYKEVNVCTDYPDRFMMSS